MPQSTVQVTVVNVESMYIQLYNYWVFRMPICIVPQELYHEFCLYTCIPNPCTFHCYTLSELWGSHLFCSCPRTWKVLTE